MSSDSQRFGKWMIWAAWFLLIAMLTVFFNDVLEKQINPNQNVIGSVTTEGVREVVLTRNRHGHYLSAGFINGHPVVFLLDTGASDVAIPANVAQRIGLKGSQAIRYQTANGPVTGFLTSLDTISLGNIELTDIRGGINPSMKDQHILLGMSFLRHVEFTQRGDKLILRQYPGEA